MAASRVIVFGYDELLLASLDFLAENSANVLAVVFPSTRTDENVNRIRAAVADRGLAIVEQPHRNESDKFALELTKLRPDIFLIWSYPMILSQNMIDIPPKRCVNIHHGLLPEYRGVNGVRWALFKCETQTGLTMHYVDQGIDTGDMIARAAFPIEPEDDIRSLMIKSRYVGVQLLTQFWPSIVEGQVGTKPQDEAKAGYYSAKMEPSAVIDWQRPGIEIHNLVRANVEPFNGARTHWNDIEIRVDRTAIAEANTGYVAGTILAADDAGPLIATGDGALRILEIEVNGEKLAGAAIKALGFSFEEKLG